MQKKINLRNKSFHLYLIKPQINYIKSTKMKFPSKRPLPTEARLMCESTNGSNANVCESERLFMLNHY